MSLKNFIDSWFGDELAGMSRDIWAQMEPWPLSTDEFVFLAPCVMQVGAAIYPEEWTGNEPYQSFLPILDTSPFQSDGDAAVYAVSLLGRFRPDLGIGPVLDFSLLDRPLTLDEMDAAVAAYLTHEADRNALATARFYEVRKAIASAAVNGRLRTYYRDVDRATHFTPIDKSWWMSWEAQRRFDFCVSNEHAPYSDVVGPLPVWRAIAASHEAGNPLRFSENELLSAWPSYVYVSRVDLDALCAQLRGEPSIAASLSGTSEGRRSEQTSPSKREIRLQLVQVLKSISDTWVSEGSSLTRKTTMRKFQALVADPGSEHFVMGSKPTWARDIWEKHSPPIWREKPGPPTDD